MEYQGAYIVHDDDGSWYWEDVNGVIHGEDFETVEECKKDIEADNAHREKFNRGPFAN